MDTALIKNSNITKRLYDMLHIFIVIVSFILIISISADTFRGIQLSTASVYLKVQLAVCIFFLVEFFFELIAAKNKFKFLKTHFLFFLISIPYLNIISLFDVSLSTEAAYIMQFIPLIRGGYAITIIVGWFTTNKAFSLLVSYLSILTASVYFASLMFLVVEKGKNPDISNFGDALWWAFMNVTTVGANIFAVTFPGKALTIFLAAIGMMMFPIFTVYVTNLVQKANAKKKQKHE